MKDLNLFETLKMLREVFDISEVNHAMDTQCGNEPYLQLVRVINKLENVKL